MTAPALAQGVGEGRSVTSTRLVRWLIVSGACAAAAASVELALASDRLAERELQVALLNWVTLPYIVAGVIAWSRRRESAFGPLMITAGVVMFISSLQWANATAPYTVGLAYDLLPAALFLHLFLAFPSGRLGRRLERIVVAAAYFLAVGLQLAKMLPAPQPPVSRLSRHAPKWEGRWVPQPRERR